MDKDTWLVILIALLLAFGSVTYATLTTTSANSRTCEVATQIARLNLEAVEESKPRTAQFERESKDRLGLSQKRFDELVTETQERQTVRALQLKALAHESC